MVIDTGAASGRLGLIALLTARYARNGTATGDVPDFCPAKNRRLPWSMSS